MNWNKKFTQSSNLTAHEKTHKEQMMRGESWDSFSNWDKNLWEEHNKSSILSDSHIEGHSQLHNSLKETNNIKESMRRGIYNTKKELV